MIDKPGQISEVPRQVGALRADHPQKPRPDHPKPNRLAGGRPLRKLQILALVEDGCNIADDIADETGMSKNLARAWVSKLISIGLLRRNGMVQPRHGPPARCFELAQPKG